MKSDSSTEQYMRTEKYRKNSIENSADLENSTIKEIFVGIAIFFALARKAGVPVGTGKKIAGDLSKPPRVDVSIALPQPASHSTRDYSEYKLFFM